MKGTSSSLIFKNNIKMDLFFTRLFHFHTYLTLQFRTICVLSKEFFTYILCVTCIYAWVRIEIALSFIVGAITFRFQTVSQKLCDRFNSNLVCGCISPKHMPFSKVISNSHQ